MKEIIIVAPDKYKDVSRILAHEISKIPGCKGASWTIQHYEDNEFQLGGQRYAIFIGNSDENPLTKNFSPVIRNLENHDGACFGFDGSKAIVFGGGKKLYLPPNLKAIVFGDGKNISMANTLVKTFTWNDFGRILMGDGRLVEERFKELEECLYLLQLLRKQTKTAADLFLKKQFYNWVGINTNGQAA